MLFALGFIAALTFVYLCDGLYLRHIGYRFTDRHRIVRYQLKVTRLKRKGWHVQHVGKLGWSATRMTHSYGERRSNFQRG